MVHWHGAVAGAFYRPRGLDTSLFGLGEPCPEGSEIYDPRIIAAGAGGVTAPGRDEFLVLEETCSEQVRLWAVVED